MQDLHEHGEENKTPTDNSQSIEPFGPLPKIGNSFYIGSNEIFSKNLTDLKIHIKWGGLPTENGGFKSYYSAYPTPINNEDFKVSIAYLNNQHWNPFYLQNRQSVPLFQGVPLRRAETGCKSVLPADGGGGFEHHPDGSDGQRTLSLVLSADFGFLLASGDCNAECDRADLRLHPDFSCAG